MIAERVKNILLQMQINRKKKISSDWLEKETIRSCKSLENYQNDGGYEAFRHAISTLCALHMLIPLHVAKKNGRIPSLDLYYWLKPKEIQSKWSIEQMAKVSDRVDLSFFRKHPEEQTVKEWRRIEILYAFLKRNNCRMLTKEQRSFLLFSGETWLPCEAEKWLDHEEGNQWMSRLKLTANDLWFNETKEPFSFFQNRNGEKIVLIVENKSLYKSCKYWIQESRWQFGTVPKIVIWGAGNKIEYNLEYLDEIVPDGTHWKIEYAGDLDYSGVSIFARLKEKFPERIITAAVPFYEYSLKYANPPYVSKIIKKQVRNDKHLAEFLKEFQHKPELVDRIRTFWKQKQRLAQEYINDETIDWSGI